MQGLHRNQLQSAHPAKRIWGCFFLRLSMAVLLLFSNLFRAFDAIAEDDRTKFSGFQGSEAGESRELAPEIVFHWCPAGSFVMGQDGKELDERPVEVTLSRGFWMAETEVTQGQYKKLMKSAPWGGLRNVKSSSENPASYVNFDDATRFCARLTKQERAADRLPMDWVYTLPTEAQWEYACRAGTKTNFSFGDDENLLFENGWYLDNAAALGETFAHAVGQLDSNPWGFKDMHGNVREWCLDWFSGMDEKPPGGIDPLVTTFPRQGQVRRSRGGCFLEKASACRSAFRGADPPTLRQAEIGFRIVAVRPVESNPAQAK